jgi:hypothetical protein
MAHKVNISLSMTSEICLSRVQKDTKVDIDVACLVGAS